MLRKKKSTKANLSSEYWNVPENQSPVTISHKGRENSISAEPFENFGNTN